MKWMIPITFFCWILACGEPEAPGPQPNVEQFFAVYQDFLNMSQSDSLAFQNEQDLLDSALARHNMQPEEFDATLEYLETHPEEFLKAFESFDSTMRQDLAPPMPD